MGQLTWALAFLRMTCKVVRMNAATQAILLDCLRHGETECGAVAVNDRSAYVAPLPRAAGRVVPWAMARARDVLRYGGRRPVRLGGAEATADERALLGIVQSLRNGDEATAQLQAEWLVKPAHNAALLRALRSAATSL